MTLNGEAVPKRAVTVCVGEDAVPPALLARCNVAEVLRLAEVCAGAPERPVTILGRRREVYADPGLPLWKWLMQQPNSKDGGGPFQAAWTELDGVLKAKAVEAAVRMGLPRRMAEGVVFAAHALIENPVTRSPADPRDAPPLAAACTASLPQVPHGDGKRLQFVFNLGPAACEATGVYAGEYRSAEWGDHQARRTPAEEETHRRELASGRVDRDLKEMAATLLIPRTDLFAGMRPAAGGAERLQPGEGVGLWGPVIHAGGGTAAGEWRVVYFCTAHLPGDTPYDVDYQVLPWTAPVDQFGSANLCKRMALEYANCQLWNNFGGQLKGAVRAACEGGRAITVATVR